MHLFIYLFIYLPFIARFEVVVTETPTTSNNLNKAKLIFIS